LFPMQNTQKKIYFSGAIRGGRDHVSTYQKIIRMLKKYGTVLTEHIGDAELSTSGEPLLDTEIYQRDMKWLHDADIVIADVSVPSLGVGYEIAKAEELNKKIACLYRSDSESALSAMIAGNRRIRLYRYGDEQDLETSLESFFKELE
jgi:nucleoside 2-deoxyribosyltransferase